MNPAENYDVAIIGGGPAGSTAGCILKKYKPDLRVAIFERERFPREHVGESLLPPVNNVLAEMGCWDKIEAANFPIKIGATFRWGKNPELWDFEFILAEKFKDEPRPAKLDGQRALTAFQVDRAIYDDILLTHAQESGCEVFQSMKVNRVLSEGDAVAGLELADGRTISARFYIDASGNSGILRKAMGVKCDYPTALQNIAIWDYWQNAEWAVKIGVGGTRIQVRSLGYGWLWFIPLGPTRTSIGLVIPAEHFKKLGVKPEEIYTRAVSEERAIADLVRNATREGNIQTTRDWSFLAERQVGENWLLSGECAGFADPILSAGVSLAHVSGLQAAYTILELFRKELDPDWLRQQYAQRQKRRISTHIGFADYWYAVNSQFNDLKEFTASLAKANGLDLSPDRAWDWLAKGGFIDEDLGVSKGGFNLQSLRCSSEFLSDLASDSPLECNNVLTLDLNGAEKQQIATYAEGRVTKTPAYTRNGKVLPLLGQFLFLTQLLQHESRLPVIAQHLRFIAQQRGSDPDAMQLLASVPESLEGMIRDGWLQASYNPSLPLVKLAVSGSTQHLNTDTR